MPARKHRATADRDHDQPVMFTNEMEADINGVPTGLLAWGQAGIFNAVDDRQVISAVSDSAVGVVRPARFIAGSGLNVTVTPGWLAIASADDGTHCVVGSRQSHQLTVAAGPASGAARRDHVWVETHPDDATWTLSLIPEAETIGRSGVSIGVITVPVGANLASQLTYSQWVPTLGRHSDAGNIDSTGTGMVRMTAAYPIPPYLIRPHNAFEVTCWGEGFMGAALSTILFRLNAGSSPIIRINPTGQMSPRDRFDWEVTGRYQINAAGTMMRSSIKAIVTRWQQNSPTLGETAAGRGMAAMRTTWGAGVQPVWWDIFVQAGFGQLSAGQRLTSLGSTYDTFQSFFFH